MHGVPCGHTRDWAGVVIMEGSRERGKRADEDP